MTKPLILAEVVQPAGSKGHQRATVALSAALRGAEGSAQAAFRRNRHHARRPPLAKIRPGIYNFYNLFVTQPCLES
jgi:hypothetical protein